MKRTITDDAPEYLRREYTPSETHWATAEIDFNDVTAVTIEDDEEETVRHFASNLGSGVWVKHLTLEMTDGSTIELWDVGGASTDGVFRTMYSDRLAALDEYGRMLWNSMPLSQAAEALGLSIRTLQTQRRNGRLHATKIGRNWFVTAREVERYRRENLGRVGRPLEGDPNGANLD